MLNEEAPSVISTFGGKYAIDDDRTIPDTMQAMYEFPSGSIATVKVLEASSGSFIPHGFIEMRGTNGTLYTGENDYKIVPTRPGQFSSWDKLMEPQEYELGGNDTLLDDNSYRNSTANLIRNFMDCIKSRKTPWSTLEIGHRSTSFAHLATISMITKERLEWDAVNEQFTNSEEANKLLSYEYRKPYTL